MSLERKVVPGIVVVVVGVGTICGCCCVINGLRVDLTAIVIAHIYFCCCYSCCCFLIASTVSNFLFTFILICFVFFLSLFFCTLHSSKYILGFPNDISRLLVNFKFFHKFILRFIAFISLFS